MMHSLIYIHVVSGFHGRGHMQTTAYDSDGSSPKAIRDQTAKSGTEQTGVHQSMRDIESEQHEQCKPLKSICGAHPNSRGCTSTICPNSKFAPGATVTTSSSNWKIPTVAMPKETLMATVSGKTVLEIGGPTPQLMHIGFYSKSKRFDNVVKTEHKEWAADKEKRIFTNDYRADGGALQAVASNASYDTVVSCHNIEHFPDVLSTVLEWDRVLKPGGRLVLIIPYAPNEFDHKRKPHDFDHLMGDYADGTQERYRCDLAETFANWDVEMDAGLHGRTSEEKRAHLKSRFYEKYGEQYMHWHVFSPSLVLQLADCLNMSVEQKPVLYDRINMLVILRK